MRLEVLQLSTNKQHQRLSSLTLMLGLLLLVFATLSGCVSQSTTSKSVALEPTIQKGPDLNEAAEQRLNLGLRYLQDGQIERAKHNLDKALKHAPNKASVQIGLAYYYQQVKEPERAKSYYLRALRIDGKNGDHLNLYGSFLCEHGDFKNAEKNFLKAVKQLNYANVGATYENAGICAKKSGKIAVAEKYFDKALDHNPNIAISLLEKAEILFMNKRYFNAKAFLTRHFAVSQPSAQSLWLGIRIEKLMGDADALSSYELKLTGLFPASDEAELYRASKNK